MKVLATDGVGAFAVFVLGAWGFARRLRYADRGVAAAFWTAVATPLAVLLNQPLVSAFHRQRPYRQLHGVEVLIARTHDYSFPSDHSVAVGAAATGLWIVAHYGGRSVRYIAIAGTVLALLVAGSRVYAGAHYPGDVLAGLIVGAVVALAGWWLVRSVLVRIVKMADGSTHLRPLVRAAANRALDMRPAG
jgi:undecaprenyl-diphosphatase